MAINNTLKDIREERNLIQADLAEAIGSLQPDNRPHRIVKNGISFKQIWLKP